MCVYRNWVGKKEKSQQVNWLITDILMMSALFLTSFFPSFFCKCDQDHGLNFSLLCLRLFENKEKLIFGADLNANFRIIFVV